MKGHWSGIVIAMGVFVGGWGCLQAADTDLLLRRWRLAEQDKAETKIKMMTKKLALTDDQKLEVQAALTERINQLSDLKDELIKKSQEVEKASEEKIRTALSEEQKADYASLKEEIEKEMRAQEMEKMQNGSGQGGRGSRGPGGGMGGPGGGGMGGPGGGGFGGPGGGF
ncbi:MAG TPA: hypothetical protein PK876_01260 [Elusimicrobiota bacterium]|nr:hypothetical protein [Elusimicrobiota bacterium]